MRVEKPGRFASDSLPSLLPHPTVPVLPSSTETSVVSRVRVHPEHSIV